MQVERGGTTACMSHACESSRFSFFFTSPVVFLLASADLYISLGSTPASFGPRTSSAAPGLWLTGVFSLGSTPTPFGPRRSSAAPGLWLTG